MYNYDARLYDPVIGRFISADSIVPRPFDPQSLNRYSYCRNNPLIYVDPTGRWETDGDYGPERSGLDNEVADASGMGYGGSENHWGGNRNSPAGDKSINIDGTKAPNDFSLVTFNAVRSTNPDSKYGHGWVKVEEEDSPPTVVGGYPGLSLREGGPRYGDDAGRKPDSTLSINVSHDEAQAVLDEMDKPGYDVENDNCIDDIERAFDRLGMSYPDFTNTKRIGGTDYTYSDPDKFADFLDGVGRIP